MVLSSSHHYDIIASIVILNPNILRECIALINLLTFDFYLAVFICLTFSCISCAVYVYLNIFLTFTFYLWLSTCYHGYALSDICNCLYLYKVTHHELIS